MFKSVSAVVVAVILGFLLLVGLAFFGVYGLGWFQRTTANYRGQTQAIEQTRANADFRLHAYKHFYDICAGVQTKETQITVLRPLATDDIGKTNLAAAQAERASLINQYNADAAAHFTEGQFRANNLPPQLDLNQEHTTCAIG